ncbi:DUF3445 domain-containing protein [Alkalihalobacillus sp. BA299]|uniref:heme-dependent oxidative N-demethylase family protein n=1 Tax=Alkalihalobacillus sp. BA299 TaxID=2815938 RepID=UPI001ADCA56A|nr:DUF3445 domain-containing protein [Alkalihalobacillus sp. BA299]
MKSSVGVSSKQSLIKATPLINRFPFPFNEDSYRYSNNSRSLEPPVILDITPEYFDEIHLKRQLLQNRHDHAYQAFSHSLEAQWEIFEMIINEMATIYPDFFHLIKEGNSWTFINHLLNEKQTFTFGDHDSLPYEPLDFIGRHIQEDLIYISQRDGDLYMDAGQLCFPANWSIAFNLGMTYTEFHSPVPQFSDSGLAERVRNFLMRMEAGKPWTRYNWTLTVEPILDTFPETYDQWGKKKYNITQENIGQLVHLRVEDQRLFRLPRSNGILFSIHTHLISLDELNANDEWANRFDKVIQDLPDYMADYKGILSYKDEITAYYQSKK